MKHTVAIDLDAVLSRYGGRQGIFNQGDPLPGALGFLHTLRLKGFRVVIHTTRVNELNADRMTSLDDLRDLVEHWLNRHHLPYDEVWAGVGKPLAIAYVDDRAVVCKPQKDGEEAFNKALEEILKLRRETK